MRTQVYASHESMRIDGRLLAFPDHLLRPSADPAPVPVLPCHQLGIESVGPLAEPDGCDKLSSRATTEAWSFSGVALALAWRVEPGDESRWRNGWAIPCSSRRDRANECRPWHIPFQRGSPPAMGPTKGSAGEEGMPQGNARQVGQGGRLTGMYFNRGERDQKAACLGESSPAPCALQSDCARRRPGTHSRRA